MLRSAKPAKFAAPDGWNVPRLERLWRQSRFFDWQMPRQLPAEGLLILQDPWRGDARRGNLILQGYLPGDRLTPAYHSFGWLRDLRDFGGQAARGLAREEIGKWIHNNQSWQMDIWRPDYIGQRLAHLIFAWGWFADSAAEDLQADIARLILHQAHCLMMDWPRLDSLQQQIVALKGLIIARTALRGEKREIEGLLDVLLPKLQKLLNPDGGHISRCPEDHLSLLRDIFECRIVAAQIGLERNPLLEDIIQQMALIARMWRHGNGSFAHFQGAGWTAASEIEDVLLRCGQRGRIAQLAPQTGYIRLASGRNTLIMDVGSPAAPPPKGAASSLAFEFSVANQLFIVNAGQCSNDDRLNRVLCQTSAHSTLTIDTMNSSSTDGSRLARILSAEAGPTEGGLLAEAGHNGYEASHGLIHQRQLWLANGGGNLRGRDELVYTGGPGELPAEAIIRFHLHPKVSAAPLSGGRVLLKITGQQAGWVFSVRGADTRLEASVYTEEGRRISCQQIVLRASLADIRHSGATSISWAFRRGS
jgi:uncharacterized heparinase superfamily protein